MVLLLIALLAAFMLGFIVKQSLDDKPAKKTGWIVVLILIPVTFALYLIGKQDKIRF